MKRLPAHLEATVVERARLPVIPSAVPARDARMLKPPGDGERHDAVPRAVLLRAVLGHELDGLSRGERPPGANQHNQLRVHRDAPKAPRARVVDDEWKTRPRLVAQLDERARQGQFNRLIVEHAEPLARAYFPVPAGMNGDNALAPRNRHLAEHLARDRHARRGGLLLFDRG